MAVIQCATSPASHSESLDISIAAGARPRTTATHVSHGPCQCGPSFVERGAGACLQGIEGTPGQLRNARIGLESGDCIQRTGVSPAGDTPVHVLEAFGERLHAHSASTREGSEPHDQVGTELVSNEEVL
jgi:hypothetical protein